MNSIMYALKLKDKFVSIVWDSRHEVFDVELEYLNVGTASWILFRKEEHILDHIKEMKNDKYCDYELYGICDEDIDNMNIVKLNINFEYEEI